MSKTALLCALAFAFPMSSLLADDAKPGAPPPEPEKVKESLNKAIAIVKALDDKKPGKDDDLPSIDQLNDSFHHSADPEYKTAALNGLASAQARCGDVEGARATLEKAAEITEEIGDPQKRTTTLVELAEGLIAAGDKEGAAESLRQAVRMSNRIKPDDRFSTLSQLAMMNGEDDPEVQRVKVMGKIAAAQRAAGDDDSARKTIAAAVELVGELSKPSLQVKALIRLAGSAGADEIEPIWQKAVAEAGTATEILEKGEVFGEIIRERIKTNAGDQALDLIAGTLKGDLQAFALWVAADEMAKIENGAPKEWLDRLFTLAAGAQFDRYPKKSKVYSRLCEAQARAGDEMGAEKTVGLLDTENSIRHSRYIHARVDMLVELAHTKLRIGNKDAALVSLTVAEDFIAPFQGDDGGQSFPVGQVAELLAKAGNVAAAREFLGQIQSEKLRVDTFSDIAVIQAKAGDREGAQASLKTALAALDNIPNEILWNNDPTGFDSSNEAYARQQVLSKVAITQAKMGEYDEALKTINTLKANGKSDSPFDNSEEILEIAKLRLETGDFEGARAMIEATDVSEYRTGNKQQALAEVAHHQAKSGAFEKTLAWVETLKSPRGKLLCLAGYGKGIAAWLAAGN